MKNNYFKDFDRWNNQKKEIELKEKTRYCKSREVWWCSMGLNIGFEETVKVKFLEDRY